MQHCEQQFAIDFGFLGDTSAASDKNDVGIDSVIKALREKRKAARRWVTENQLVIEFDALSQKPKENVDQESEWTEESIQDLRFEILVDALSKLCDNRVSKSAAQEALEWILSDEEAPFSYVVCCGSEGLRHNDLRDLALFHHKKYHKA